MNFDFPARRARIARALALTDEVLLIGSGHPLPKPEISDALLPYIAHQEYYFLTGHLDAIGGILAFDPRDGAWTSFVPEVTEMDRVWEGREQLPGEPLTSFPAWFSARRGRPVVLLGAPVSGISADETRTAAVRERYKHARRPKEAAEIAVLQRGAAATAAGYAAIQPLLRPGVSERTLQIELEAEYFRHGAQTTGYDSIVGVGPQSAVFHGSPSPDRVARNGDFILIDSGAQVDRYVTDVTRTYVAGRASPFQRDLYQVVLGAQERTCALCRPGAEWKDLHYATATDLMTGLAAMGVVRGNPSSLVEQEVHTLFYPHGLGHMVGLGVRDASGLEPGRTRDPRPSLRSLRMDLILREGYVVTVEPGLYFIPALLRDAGRRSRYAQAVDWDLVDRHLHLGGVRIEDNLLVTAGAPLNLTAAIPKDLK
ncbi:Xaa-Pro aminopeptidase [Lacunisphaera limnophila]|uniref:Xaa-Pro aminopeptidase n=1 Tax=Lacunisphaera limnophila TaxID=1838286 RepID=A0A1D8AR12_9BACT|nr:M24 family metallopeptidase [Lacunisphaera limnophila]AOS43294.1 Xaa-Pro aminopeptidase [Lacunisphaera limnophila]